MNKKFSTLVASLLLVAGSGAYTPVSAAAAVIDVKTDVQGTVTLDAVKAYDEASKTGGYQVGKSYFLSGDGSEVLYIDLGSKTLRYSDKIKVENTDKEILKSRLYTDRALWTLTSINAPEGAVAPQYTFVNKATGVVLAMDPSKAVAYDDREKGISTLGGSQTEWLQAPSYRDPAAATNAIYAAVKNDEVVAFVEKTDGSVTLVKMAKADLSNALQVKPHVVKSTANVFTLSPNELNTMLGKAGVTATKDNFFSLGFAPVATVNGERNIWADDLQAVAVEQFELAYGEDPEDATWLTETEYDAAVTAGDTKVNGLTFGIVKDEFASLYPSTGVDADNKYAGAYKARTKKDSNDPRFLANEDSYRDGTPQWVALRNREGKFLVVDTAYVKGTSQESSPRITFTYDDLYNARTETRFRNPNSYLFRFDYNPVTGSLEIKSKAYIEKRETNNDGSLKPTDKSDAFGETKTEADFYAAYNEQAKKLGSYWTGATSANISSSKNVIKVALGPVTEVSLGNLAGDNRFSITLGNAAAYVPTIKANTAYLLKIAGSKDKSKIGKYVIDNLVGSREIIAQAKRQNFQDMPAAQWILTSPTVTAGAPVTLTNREFTNMYVANVTMFAVEGQPNQAFFMGSDTLEFIPVTSLKDPYLGYKYVADDTIKERTFTFNYLHELKMNCPINTKDNKDSVVWVDVNGNAINFVLEKIADDAYGTNCGLSSISSLTRRIYAIKVNDATKLQNDGRYLAYDSDQKKYILSTSEKAHFFLKENNEVEGGECYYTLVEPFYMKNTNWHFVQVKGDGSADNKFEKAGTFIDDNVFDNDARGAFVAFENKAYKDPETGLDAKRWEVNVEKFTTQELYNKAVKELPWPYEYVSFPEAGKDYAAEVEYAKRVNPAYNVASWYALSKLSVDNNTLDLVNGVLSDGSGSEVANSAFAVVVNNDPLYRRFNTELEGLATDAPDTVKFYRVNATEKEFLYEDATSKYSKDKEFNFLGVEDKGVIGKNASIFVDTAYVRGNTNMPQYLLAVRPNIVPADTVLCDATTHAHKTEADRLTCPHTSITKGYVDAWYLVNLQDSVDVHEGLDAAKYQWNNAYTRLGFVEARHIDDTLVIKNSIYTGNNNPIEIGKAATWAGKDSIFLGDNTHKNVVFSFRLVKSGSNDFLIESEGNKIAPEQGGWIKIQNGVPVIAKYETYNEAGRDAEIFNVEKTVEQPTANESIEASEVNVTAAAGAVIVKNAAGKKVAISNILGQTIATVVLTSDNETIAVPAGIVVVAVEGEDAVKTVVK